jgi:ribosomal protein S18 acetylase RimI-like enzyme
VQEEKHSIFFSRAWFECLTATALDDDHTLVLACVVSGDNVMAMLPLMQSTGNKTWYSLKHGFTPLYSLLIADEAQERVLSFLAEALSHLPVKGLLLEPVANDDSKLNSLQRFLEIAGFNCERLFRGYNWIYRLQGQSYGAYMSGRPAQLRNTISRKKRKLEREHGYEIRLFTGDEVPRAMPDYYVVYNASWKQNELKNAGFQDCVVEGFSRAGWSRLAILYIKRQPVAAQLWFVHHNKASIFRLAYDKAWRQYSTGSILTSFLMEYVIDTDRVDEIDFLTGNDAYKQDWMSERRERFLLSCVKSIIPESRYQRFVESLKHILKRR